MEHLQHPVYWFVMLEKSRQNGDREAAEYARRELRRLGVEVHFKRQGKQKQLAKKD